MELLKCRWRDLSLRKALVLYVAAAAVLALLFYQNKLKRPLAELCRVSEKIFWGDLDFTVSTDRSDELGQLCASFETMRVALVQNFSKMWGQIEEHKRLNAAFAHALRTPLTVLEGVQ